MKKDEKTLFELGRDCYGGILEARFVARMETEGRNLTDAETVAECEYILDTVDYSGRDGREISQIKRACRYLLKKASETATDTAPAISDAEIMQITTDSVLKVLHAVGATNIAIDGEPVADTDTDTATESEYDIYRAMMQDIPEIEATIRERLTNDGYTVYTVFLSVAVEAERLYFVDIEYSKNGDYNRIYRRMDKDALLKYFHISNPCATCKYNDACGDPERLKPCNGFNLNDAKVLFD